MEPLPAPVQSPSTESSPREPPGADRTPTPAADTRTSMECPSPTNRPHPVRRSTAAASASMAEPYRRQHLRHLLAEARHLSRAQPFHQGRGSRYSDDANRPPQIHVQ